MMSDYYFQYLLNNCDKELYIYDCSMIKNELFILNKQLIVLELHYCGQLRDTMLNSMISNMSSLKKLVIKGGFLLNNIKLPKNVEHIDVSDCSRLKDDFIDYINGNYECLKMVKLSKCYGLTEHCMLRVFVECIHICDTNLSHLFFKFLLNVGRIRELSIRKCPNLFRLNNKNIVILENFKQLEYLDIEGISTIKQLNVASCLRHLNLTCCYNVEIGSLLLNVNLEYLNLSRLNLGVDGLKMVVRFVELRVVILNWSEKLTDDVLEYILMRLSKLEVVHVFGCFNLSERSGEMAWERKNKVRIIGNPAETRFLLNN